MFTDGNDRVRFNPATYPNDDWGLDGNLSTTMVFDQPQNWFAAYTPGLLSIRLYSQGTLFYTSNVAAEFNGVISDIPFDQVQVFDPGDSNVNMDDIHFGATPAPGAIVILTGFLLSRGKSRKRNV